MDRRQFILDNTRITRPVLCPELKLYLITEACPLWQAGERDLEALSIGDPYWGFCWAGGQALARHILDHSETVQGKRVLVFGAGCGVETIAAAKSGATRVLGSDTDPFSVEAVSLNARLNGVDIETTVEDLLGKSLEGFDVLLAGDMFYDPDFSRNVLAWFEGLAARGMEIYLADPGRGNLPEDSAAMEKVGSYPASADVDLSGEFLVTAQVFLLR